MSQANKNEPIKAIGYIRVSTLKQGQNGYGLKAQLDAIQKYCKDNGIDLLTVIPDVMSSRKTEKMHGRAAAVAAIQAGIADVLIVRALDRATRDTVDGGQLIKQAKDEGWRLLSLDGVDSSDEDQEFLNNMRLAFAMEERKKISERTKAGLARARREGKQLGKPSTIPRTIIDRILDLRRDGLGAKAIATQLTAEAVPAPGGKMWHYSTVRNVLAREGL